MMQSPAPLSSLLLSVCLLLHSGCSSSPSSKGVKSGNYGNPAIWLNTAEAHESKGDLQSALFDLKVARTVSVRDTKINAAIKRVEAKIAAQSEKKMSQGNRAVRQGKLNKARRYYLEVLGLNPKHKQALAAMRKLDERASKASMKKKVAVSYRNYNNRTKRLKFAKGFEEEAYIYSRQEILQAEEKQSNPAEYIKEIETHLNRFPKDKEVRDLLSKTLLKHANNAFEAEKYNDALSYLKQAEHAFNGDAKKLKKIQQQRKAYGKALYIKGVRSSREEPVHAIKYWEYALKFDPDDKKSSLRLRSIKSM
ncbi:MAG: tetratricopeptide repeat protein [Candidatus Thiodiazotropha sp.]